MRKTAEFLMNFSHNHAIFHIWCTSVWAVCRNIVRHKLEENHLACFHVFVWSQNHHRHIFHGICSNKKSIYQMEGGRESSGRSRVSERKRENFSRCAHMSHTCSWDYLQCRNICILQFTESVRVWILTGAQNDHLSPRVCVFASLVVVVFFFLSINVKQIGKWIPEVVELVCTRATIERAQSNRRDFKIHHHHHHTFQCIFGLLTSRIKVMRVGKNQ